MLKSKKKINETDSIEFFPEPDREKTACLQYNTSDFLLLIIRLIRKKKHCNIVAEIKTKKNCMQTFQGVS